MKSGARSLTNFSQITLENPEHPFPKLLFGGQTKMFHHFSFGVCRSHHSEHSRSISPWKKGISLSHSSNTRWETAKYFSESQTALPSSKHRNGPPPTWMSQEGSNHLLINGAYWGYNPVTNHLLTSWDIQVSFLVPAPYRTMVEKAPLCWRESFWNDINFNGSISAPSISLYKITTYKSEDVSKCMVPSQSLTASLPLKSYRAPIGKANVFQAPFFGGRLLFNFRGVFLDERPSAIPGFTCISCMFFWGFQDLPGLSSKQPVQWSCEKHPHVVPRAPPHVLLIGFGLKNPLEFKLLQLGSNGCLVSGIAQVNMGSMAPPTGILHILSGFSNKFQASLAKW